MDDENKKYRDAAVDGIRELEVLAKEIKEREAKFSKIYSIVAANIAMLPASQRPDLGAKLEATKAPTGLSKAVLRVLRYDKYMAATEVRDALTASGYDLSAQTNALASVHTTLKRLTEAPNSRVRAMESHGRTVYRRLPGVGRKILEGIT